MVNLHLLKKNFHIFGRIADFNSYVFVNKLLKLYNAKTNK